MSGQRRSSSPQLITERSALYDLVERLAKRPRIALDTEAASFHRYVDRVYLVQVSSEELTALVDPIAVSDLTPIGKLLADPSVQVVFHDADYDLRILDRDFRFRAHNVFDTRIAAQFAGEPSVGLGALLEKHFGVKPNKKLQRADWSRRPLTPEMIAYAADDTRFLLQLKDRLQRQLTRAGRLAWAEEEFKQLERVRWKPAQEEAEAFLRVKGARGLSKRSLAVLRELFEWRESKARAADRAPFRVLSNAALIALARSAPRTIGRLRRTQGIPSSAAARYGEDLVEAISRGVELPKEKWPRIKRPERPNHDVHYDRRLERLKVLRNKRADEISMEPGMMCPNGTLQAIARAAPTSVTKLKRVEELRDWQLDVLGQEELFTAVLGEFRNPATT